jgi:hypothetical protein
MSIDDPLALLRRQMAEQAKPKPTDPGVPKFDHTPAPGFELVFQRLRYFENLVEHLFAHTRTLTAQLVRTGTAPAGLPHFPALKSAAGDFDPNTK